MYIYVYTLKALIHILINFFSCAIVLLHWKCFHLVWHCFTLYWFCSDKTSILYYLCLQWNCFFGHKKWKNHSQELFNLSSCSSEETSVSDTGVAIFWCTLNENTEFEIKIQHHENMAYMNIWLKISLQSCLLNY